MNPITHCLASWTLADRTNAGVRDRCLVTWAGVLPDVDGLGAVVDSTRSFLGMPVTAHYEDYHHLLLHGLPGAIAISGLLALFAVRRGRVFVCAFVAVHLHLLCDIAGSRGPDPGDIWPVWYLAPFSEKPVILWAGQWPLNAWQNIAFTIALLGYALWAAAVRGHSPVEIVSRRADPGVVAAVKARWARARLAMGH